MRSLRSIVSSAFVSVSLACAAAALVSACSDSSDTSNTPKGGGSGGKCVEYKVPAGTDLKSPVIGFQTQVIPLLQKHCSYGDCHGKAVVPILGFFGGSADGGEADNGPTAQEIKANLVNKPSQILPTMKMVAPGDPSKSFMMRTMDGDHCLFNDECVNKTCGEQMPNDRPVLSVQERDVVRRWIAQGAQ